MQEKIRKHGISIKHAISGLKWALTTQPNFKIHLILSALAVTIGWYVDLSSGEWVLLVFTIFWGLSSEMINTAIESVTDLVTKEWHEEAKIAKDVSAGMMLTIAFGTILVACLLLLPKLLLKLLG